MERLARDKIAAQQRLAALRKEVSTIPAAGSTNPVAAGAAGADGQAGPPHQQALLDLGSVIPSVLHQHQHHHLHHHHPALVAALFNCFV